LPWDEVAVNPVGLWNVTVHGRDLEFQVHSIIDPFTGLLEFVCIFSKEPSHIALLFENNWLACYPCPLRCIHDQGGKFIGDDFQLMLLESGIQNAPTTIKILKPTLSMNAFINPSPTSYEPTYGCMLQTTNKKLLQSSTQL
jgi:hypothetical protein